MLLCMGLLVPRKLSHKKKKKEERREAREHQEQGGAGNLMHGAAYEGVLRRR